MEFNIVFVLHISATVSVFLSGLFIMTVRGVKRPILFMLLYRLFSTLIMIVNIFQTYQTHYYVQSIWNPLHLLALLLFYPVLFGYMIDFMRPGAIKLRYWLWAYVPLAAFMLLFFGFGIFRGTMPLFTNYAAMRPYLSEPALWVCFTAAAFFLATLSVYTVRTVRLLKEHTRTLEANFSYTKGITLQWMWWNTVLALTKAVLIMLSDCVQGQVFKVLGLFVIFVEAILTTTWVLRQKDLYESIPVTEEGQDMSFTEDANIVISSAKYRVLKHSLLLLLNKDEIFKDPELNSAKVCLMLGTNRTYLSQVINQEMNTSFYQLINSYRLAKAMEMIKDPLTRRIPLKSISEICGFKSMSAFSSFFKQTHGVTPSEWKKGC